MGKKPPPPIASRSVVVGRYLVGPALASGGMAAVHLGRLLGSAGFSRTVAVKRLHQNLSGDPGFVVRFVDEARVASRVRHANVVPTIDVVDAAGEVLLVLEYVHGESLARLLRRAAERGVSCPPKVASAIMVGVLRGLHAAHDAKSADGAPLDLVHRDVSPQNVLVGGDGVARVLDFGIAKARGNEHVTVAGGGIRGKLAYMAPEQIVGEPLDRRADLFAAGVMLWEALAGDRLFRGEDAATTMQAVFHRAPPALAGRAPGIGAAIDDVLALALAKDASGRFATANDMARAVEAAIAPGSDREVAEWVEAVAGDLLAARAAVVAAFENDAEDAAADEDDALTERRTAIVPPPMRDEARTLPAVDPVLFAPRASHHEALRTPMSMVAPAEPPACSMGETRIEPLLPRRAPVVAAPPKRRASFAARLALAALLPPAVAAAVFAGVRTYDARFTPPAFALEAPPPADEPAPPPAGEPAPPPPASAAVVASAIPPRARAPQAAAPPHARSARPPSPGHTPRPRKR